MNEMVTLNQEQSEKVLRTVINEKTPAIMSYSSRGKWHVAKVVLVDLNEQGLKLESLQTNKKQYPINIQVDQPVGISFKHNFGKFVFDTTVINLEPSSSGSNDLNNGGTIVLAPPEQIKVVERRSYYRVTVPESLKIKVLLWHRNAKHDPVHSMQSKKDLFCEYCQGKLIDISAGGIQLIAPFNDEDFGYESDEKSEESDNSMITSIEEMNFKKGQFVGVRFTPMPYEMPITLSAQIRSVLPTEDGQCMSIGLQIVGLEASPEGHQVLSRLVGVVGKYYQLNQTGEKVAEKEKQEVSV